MNTSVTKQLKFIVSALATLILGCSCTKGKPGGIENPDNPGLVVPVGKPDGSPVVSKEIGPEGGELKSDDGKFSIRFPVGALTEKHTISIQRISNSNPIGAGLAYRIEPKNVHFAQAAVITAAFEGSDDGRSGLAFHGKDGIWKAVGGIRANVGGKNLEALTDHLDDWSLYTNVFVHPESAALQPGETLPITVYSLEDLLGHLPEGKEKPIGKPVRISDKDIKKWTLNGPGKFEPKGAEATYTASTNESDANDATVSVELNLKGNRQFICLVHITIEPAGVKLVYGDNPPVRYPNAIASVNGPQVAITAGDDNGVFITFNWVGEEGFYPFAGDRPVQFAWFPTAYDHYSYFYNLPNSEEVVVSGGGITVTDMGNTDRFVKGSFELNPAGKEMGNRVAKDKVIKGTFTARKR